MSQPANFSMVNDQVSSHTEPTVTGRTEIANHLYADSYIAPGNGGGGGGTTDTLSQAADSQTPTTPPYYGNTGGGGNGLVNFGKDALMAVGAYNVGLGVVNRWRRNHDQAPVYPHRDLFTEAPPAGQTTDAGGGGPATGTNGTDVNTGNGGGTTGGDGGNPTRTAPDPPRETYSAAVSRLGVRFKDGTETGKAWLRYYNGSQGVFPANELDAPSELAPGAIASAPADEEVFRREITAADGHVHGWLIGQHLGEVGTDGRYAVANWYTAIDPGRQSGGMGAVLADNTYSKVFNGNPNAFIIAEVEHSGIDTGTRPTFPSSADLKTAAGDGTVTELPAAWPRDKSVAIPAEAGPNAPVPMSGLGQRLKRLGFWSEGRRIVPETQAGAAGADAAETILKPTVIKRTWIMPGINNPDDPAADSPAHLFVWTKDGQPISRQDAYDTMFRMYTKGYRLSEDHRLVQQLKADYTAKPKLFDSIEVAAERTVL